MAKEVLVQPPAEKEENKMLEQMLNKMLEAHNMKATIYEGKIYFTDKKGNALSDDELLKRLEGFRKSLIEWNPKTTEEKRQFALVLGMLKEDGLKEEDTKRIDNAIKNGTIDDFVKNAKDFLNKSEFTIGEKKEAGEKGEGGAAYEGVVGTTAHLINNEKWKELWLQSPREVFHTLISSGKVDKKVEEEVKQTGGTIYTAGVTIEEQKIYVRTTGKKEGAGETNGMFVVSFTEEELEKMNDATITSLIELARAGQAGLSISKDGEILFRKKVLVSKDGELDVQQYKEFLYVNRKDNAVKEKIRSNIRKALGDEIWKAIEEEARKAYKRDYGEEKKMDVLGFTTAISYGASLYQYEKKKKETQEKKKEEKQQKQEQKKEEGKEQQQKQEEREQKKEEGKEQQKQEKGGLQLKSPGELGKRKELPYGLSTPKLEKPTESTGDESS